MKKNYIVPQVEDLAVISAAIMDGGVGVYGGSGNQFSEEDAIEAPTRGFSARPL